MYDSYHTTPKDITMEGLGEEVRALLSSGHVNELNRLKRHHITDSVVLDRYALTVDERLSSGQGDELTDCR